MSEYEQVKAFHLKFGVPTDETVEEGPLIPDPDVVRYRAGFLQEELDEYVKACAEGDLEGAIDALLDLVYVAKGTSLIHGVSPGLWNDLWNDVQRANLSKERATGADDPRSKRAHSLDVVKPAGWVGPRGAEIITRHRERLERTRAALAEAEERRNQPWNQKEKVPISGQEPTDPDAPAPRMALKENGQHEDYWVLPAHERAKGFIRPYRDSYKHVGVRPSHPLRDLTAEELERYGRYDYVKYEEYPEGAGALGRYWTERDLSSGCQGVTTMSRPLSETYARDPSFYGSTFCVHCRNHFSVAEFTWTADGEVVGS